MKVVRKINTSAVLAVDDDGRELVALGRGIGFCDAGSQLDPSRVQRTFYNVDARYVGLMDELPVDVLEFSSHIIDLATGLVPYELSPNLPFILADHIAFAVERARKGIVVHMPFSYDLRQQYPVEYKIGEFAVKSMQKQFDVRMPKYEITGVAMAFINNMVEPRSDFSAQKDAEAFDGLLDQATSVIEHELGVSVDRMGFNFARYATHMQYLFDRMRTDEQLATTDEATLDMYESVTDTQPHIAACVDAIDHIFLDQAGHNLTKEERLYLFIHVNRFANKEGKTE